MEATNKLWSIKILYRRCFVVWDLKIMIQSLLFIFVFRALSFCCRSKPFPRSKPGHVSIEFQQRATSTSDTIETWLQYDQYDQLNMIETDCFPEGPTIDRYHVKNTFLYCSRTILLAKQIETFRFPFMCLSSQEIMTCKRQWFTSLVQISTHTKENQREKTSKKIQVRSSNRLWPSHEASLERARNNEH